MIQRLIERLWQAQLLPISRSAPDSQGTQPQDHDLRTWMIETQIYGWMR